MEGKWEEVCDIIDEIFHLTTYFEVAWASVLDLRMTINFKYQCYVNFAQLTCRAGVILASECLVFSKRKLWPPSLILTAAEGWGEQEHFTEGWEWGSEYFRPSFSPYPHRPLWLQIKHGRSDTLLGAFNVNSPY